MNHFEILEIETLNYRMYLFNVYTVGFGASYLLVHNFYQELKTKYLLTYVFFYRCRSIKFCGRHCQRSEFKNHNEICNFISSSTKDLKKIEETYQKFKLSPSAAPQNILKTQVGDFWELTDHQYWEKTLDSGMWPRAYLIKRLKLATALWRVADSTNLGKYFDLCRLFLLIYNLCM